MLVVKDEKIRNIAWRSFGYLPLALILSSSSVPTLNSVLYFYYFKIVDGMMHLKIILQLFFLKDDVDKGCFFFLFPLLGRVVSLEEQLMHLYILQSLNLEVACPWWYVNDRSESFSRAIKVLLCCACLNWGRITYDIFMFFWKELSSVVNSLPFLILLDFQIIVKLTCPILFPFWLNFLDGCFGGTRITWEVSS